MKNLLFITILFSINVFALTPGINQKSLKSEIVKLIPKNKNIKNFNWSCKTISNINVPYKGRSITDICQINTDVGINFKVKCEINYTSLGGATNCYLTLKERRYLNSQL